MKSQKKRTIVFCNSKNSSENAMKKLNTMGIKAKLYSQGSFSIAKNIKKDVEKGQRIEGLSKFSSGEVKVLVATQILEHGIFFDKVDQIINFNFPVNGRMYLKRAEKITNPAGVIINFVKKSEETLSSIIKTLIEKNAEIEPEISSKDFKSN